MEHQTVVYNNCVFKVDPKWGIYKATIQNFLQNLEKL